MYLRPRHRRGQYPLAQERTFPRSARVLIALGALLLALYLLWSLVTRLLSGIGLERAGAQVLTEERGTTTVTIEEQDQRAENGMLLLPGESLHTGASARASLKFFEGTSVRLEESTDLLVEESGRGDPSRIELSLVKGSIWMRTASTSALSGAAIRRVSTPTLTFSLPAGTEAVLQPTSLTVYTTDGDGVTVSMSGLDDFVISEGQAWTLPASGSVEGNVFAHRTPIDPSTAVAPFVLESRRILTIARAPVSPDGGGVIGSEVLTVSAPKNGQMIEKNVVKVDGAAGAGVTAILVNGQPALLTPTGTFTQQVSPPAGTGDFEITVRALDADRNILAEVRRSVTHPPLKPLAAPTVTSPAREGQTWRTQQEELILRGGAPAGAIGIQVNDYRLQLFSPEKGEWSYVASTRLRNMVPGTNTYDVIAIDAAGQKSPAARITILLEEGTVGVVSTSSAAAASTGPLPSNAPLLPGTLKVTAPSAGLTHTETGTGFLLEGTTSGQTSTVSVNDYQLQLYRPGKTTWNYIADVGFNNLKAGKNVYVIVARNSQGEILDRMEYTVEYTP